MASKELIEKVARAFEREDMKAYEWTEEQFAIWWEHDARNRNKPRQYNRASLAISTILSAIAEPSEAMLIAGLRITRDPGYGHIHDATGSAVYRAMLAASPLGEQSE